MSIYAELTLNWFLFSSFDVHSYMFSELWLFDILSRVKKGLVIRMRICGRILWKEITFSLSYNFKLLKFGKQTPEISLQMIFIKFGDLL